MVLPHKLVPWMLENGIYPEEALDRGRVSEYWDHLASCLPWASEHVRRHGSHFQPLALWGDDAQYNEMNDKLCCVSLMAVLDDRKTSVVSVWPLFSYRVETRMQLY